MATPSTGKQERGGDMEAEGKFPGPPGALEQRRCDREWFEDHRDELIAQYPEQWLAIYKEEVALHNPSLEKLIREAWRVMEDRIGDIVVEQATLPPKIVVYSPYKVVPL